MLSHVALRIGSRLAPAAIAVRKDDLTLAQFINGALRELVTGGSASPLLKIEAEVGAAMAGWVMVGWRHVWAESQASTQRALHPA